MRKIYAMLIMAQMGVVYAQTPLLVEDFDYPESALLTDNGWGAQSAGGTNPVSVVAPGLTFADYYGSGIGNAASVSNTGEDVNKSFGEQTSGSVYASFLVKADASVADQYFFLLGADPITTAFRARTYIVPDATDETKFAVGLAFNTSTPQEVTSTLYNFGQTYLFVVKYTIIEGADNDMVSIFVFEEGQDFMTEPATATIGPLTGSNTDVNVGTVGLRQFSSDQDITVDGIRVSTVWDVDNSNNSVGSFTSNNVKLYPNPVNGNTLNISGFDNGIDSVELFDVTGKKVLQANNVNSAVNVARLTNGVYIARITSGSATATKRIVVNH